MNNPFNNIEEYARQLKDIERIEQHYANKRKNATSVKKDDIVTGRIYMISSIHTQEIYIGCTIQSLKQRFAQHKTHFKMFLTKHKDYLASYEILRRGDCEITELEYFQGSYGTLLNIEANYIQLTPNCVNILKNRCI